MSHWNLKFSPSKNRYSMSHWCMSRFCLCFKWRHFGTGGRTRSIYIQNLLFPNLSRWHYIVMKWRKRNVRWPTQLIYCSAWVWHAIKTVFFHHLPQHCCRHQQHLSILFTHIVKRRPNRLCLFWEQLSYDTICVCIWNGQIMMKPFSKNYIRRHPI